MTPAAVTRTVAKTGVATAGVILLTNHLPVLGAITVIAIAVFLGVALPAVWSAKPARRAAALAVLKEILATVSRTRSP